MKNDDKLPVNTKDSDEKMKELMIPNNAIIVTSANNKRKLLKKLNSTTLQNVKVITIPELRQKFYFTYG